MNKRYSKGKTLIESIESMNTRKRLTWKDITRLNFYAEWGYHVVRESYLAKILHLYTIPKRVAVLRARLHREGYTLRVVGDGYYIEAPVASGVMIVYGSFPLCPVSLDQAERWAEIGDDNLQWSAGGRSDRSGEWDQRLTLHYVATQRVWSDALARKAEQTYRSDPTPANLVIAQLSMPPVQ